MVTFLRHFVTTPPLITDRAITAETGGKQQSSAKIAFLGYTFVSSALAAMFGIVAMKITKAGQGVNLGAAKTGYAVNVAGSLIEWIPDNIFSSLSNVQIIIFTIFFSVRKPGQATSKYNPPPSQPS